MKKLNEWMQDYHGYLCEEEKAASTVGQYCRDVAAFLKWLGNRSLNKGAVVEYKSLLGTHHAPACVNTVLSALNGFFKFIGRADLSVKLLRVQKNPFASEEKELTRREYERLLAAAERKGNRRLSLLMQTICSTGIRVSELKHVTVAAVGQGKAEIQSKGKLRTVYFSRRLCQALQTYAREQKIKSGPVFVSKNGMPLDRSNIWSDMKKICREAGVAEGKVFPHNLRYLFARTYYSAHKDIVRLADILGHSSVNTTRIYTAESGSIHQRQLQHLGLFIC